MSRFRGAALAASLCASVSPCAVLAAGPTTPIQHVIVIVGENHTFDNVFGAYRPRGGQKILNLRSQGIIKGDGHPGPAFAAARQKTANPGGTYSIDPTRTGTYAHLPQPDTTYATGLPGN